MNLTCSNKSIKYLMFVFNFIFVITGIIILAMGVSVKAYYYPYDTFLDDKYFSLPNMLIATGSLIFIVSFLGCYGAIRENWLMLMAFSILLAIIFIFELSIGIAGYVLRDKTSNYLENKLTETMVKYNTSPAINSMWDLIQEEFQCCGVYNASDWQTVFGSYVLPISCCPAVTGTVGNFYCNSYTTPATEATKAIEATTKEIEATTTPESVSPESVNNGINNATNDGNLLQSASLVLQAQEIETTTGEPQFEAAAEPTDLTTETSSIVTETSPIVTETSPIVTETSPIVTETSPIVTETSPIVTETSLTEFNSDLTDATTPDIATSQTTSITTQETPNVTVTSTNVPTFTAYPTSTSNPYTTGCEAAFGNFLKAHAVDIGGVGIALAVLQLVGILFSFHLARQLKNGYYST